MYLYILIRETRYKAVHHANHTHTGHHVVSASKEPPSALPRLNSWQHDKVMNVNGYQAKYTLHKVEVDV